MMRTVAVIALGSALLVGCSGGGGDDAGVASPSSAPVTSADTATVAQYASAVAREERDFRAVASQVDECNSNWTITCTAYAITVNLRANVIELVLKGAQKEGVPAYIGPVPEEIQTLVDDTVTSAQSVQSASKAWDKSGCTDLSGSCTAKFFDLWSASQDLVSQLDAWSPYQ